VASIRRKPSGSSLDPSRCSGRPITLLDLDDLREVSAPELVAESPADRESLGEVCALLPSITRPRIVPC
jgi:hypothetical protein